MAVFHPNHDELHGFTVCLETHGDMTYVGRWDHQHEGRILLLGVAQHRDGDGGVPRAEFIRQSALWGVRQDLPQVIINASDMKSVRKLGEIATELRGW